MTKAREQKQGQTKQTMKKCALTKSAVRLGGKVTKKIEKNNKTKEHPRKKQEQKYE